MRKQRWRKTKTIYCWLCPNKINKTKEFKIDSWAYRGKHFVRCNECMNIKFPNH